MTSLYGGTDNGGNPDLLIGGDGSDYVTFFRLNGVTGTTQGVRSI